MIYSCVRAYGDIPVVERADHVDQGEHDAGHHRHAEPGTGQQQGLQCSAVEWTGLLQYRHEAHSQEGEPEVAPQLQRDDGVRLPRLVDLAKHAVK